MSLQIDVERHASDGFTLWAMVGGYLVHRRYVGYSVRDAKRLFRAYVATVTA